jgi:hypothetical protein
MITVRWADAGNVHSQVVISANQSMGPLDAIINRILLITATPEMGCRTKPQQLWGLSPESAESLSA